MKKGHILLLNFMEDVIVGAIVLYVQMEESGLWAYLHVSKGTDERWLKSCNTAILEKKTMQNF